MHLLYAALEREAKRLIVGRGDNTVANATARNLLGLAQRHGAAEFDDIRRIVALIDARCTSIGVRKTAAVIIRQEIYGNFLTLRRTDVREHLVEQFRKNAVDAKDKEVAAWLKDTSAEEVTHERAILALLKSLGGHRNILASEVDEDTIRSFVLISHDVVFSARQTSEACEYILDVAKLTAKSKTDKALIVALARPALCMYWSYCTRKPVAIR